MSGYERDTMTTCAPVILRELERFDALARRNQAAASTEAISKLAAAALWLQRNLGNRQTYDYVQDIADKLVEHGEPDLSPTDLGI
jgi:hypothetical protein